MSSIRVSAAAIVAAAATALIADIASGQGHCRAAHLPVEMPSVDAVVDSAAIAALLVGSGAEGVFRFSIVADAGEAPRVYPIADRAESPATEWLTPRIEGSLRPARKSSTPWGVRLTAVADTAPSISLERSEYCRARPIPPATPVTIRVMRRASAPPPVISPYSVRISSGGSVHGVTFLRPADRDLESQIRSAATRMRYHPARIDGVAVAAVDTIGVR